MTGAKPPPKGRVYVERNVYIAPSGRFEIGYRDSNGRQRWKTLPAGDGIMAARTERDTLLAARGRGERVVPNPKLKFGVAADRWLAGPVATLRPQTRASYANSVATHLAPRWGSWRLDHITPDDVAGLVADMRELGRAEWTISTVLRALHQVFAYAQQRLSWTGTCPTTMLARGERPKVGATARRRIFTGAELAQTLQAAHEPWRTVFMLAAVSGARESELLGLLVSDVDLSDPAAATVTFTHQLSRPGKGAPSVRVPLKTEAASRTVELPRSLARILLEHVARSPRKGAGALLFATRDGKPLGQRNVVRALRIAQENARDEDGRPTFPGLFEQDDRGELVVDDRGRLVLAARASVPRATVPSFHGFRHSAASEAIAAGGSVEEISWQLGHKSSTVTRSVYLHEVKSAERTAHRRNAMEDRYGAMIEARSAHVAAEGKDGATDAAAPPAEVVDLRDVRHRER